MPGAAARAMPMGIALQLLFTGLGIGSIYALVALGFVLIYRATNVVNFAQGGLRHAWGVFDGRALH
jgi:branched-subunit amino acid ABC-type transport system permease component